MVGGFKSKALSLRLLAAALLALSAFLASAQQSRAQDPFSDFFGNIFGSPHSAPSRAPAERPRVRRMMPHQENRPPTYWRSGEAARATQKRTKRPEPETKEAAAAPEIAANYFVAVMGDTLGQQLANGLEEYLADKPEIGVLKKAKENSGLVRDDFFDWTKAAKDIAGGQQKTDVAVIMIGVNDRQPLRDGAKSEDPLSPRWRELYAARVRAVLAAFREKKIPVVWVGLPVMKNESFSADAQKLNEVYREEVAKEGGVYVDIWEALADERGQFTAFGPDINGQIVKLRAADGIHLTDSGSLSVAHFVANEIKKLYDGMSHPPAPEQSTASAPAAPEGETPARTGAAAATAAPDVVFRSPVNPLSSSAPALPDRPAVGPIQALTPAPGAGPAQLARHTSGGGADNAPQALARHVFMEGGDQTPRANRADDYSWKPVEH